MKKRKINYFRILIIIIITLLTISNLYLIIDRSKNYFKKDLILELALKYDNISVRLLNELFPEKTFYFKDGELNASDVLKVKKNNYDFEKYLDISDNIYKYEDPKLNTQIGIDVSSHNGTIDWDKVKAQGVDFAIIRVGYRGYSEGLLHLDSYFEDNMKGAIKAGLDVGVYFFSSAISEEEIDEEIEFILDNIKNYTFSYPVIFDLEEVQGEDIRTSILNSEKVTKLTRRFVDSIKEAGYTPMIYGNRNWLMGMLDLSQFEDIDKWLALYSDDPNYVYDFKIWQYSNVGVIDGIIGNADLNISFKDYKKEGK